ncbi:MAG: hypothetical protein AB7O38_03875 [Pirellulaceae bacterium]
MRLCGLQEFLSVLFVVFVDFLGRDLWSELRIEFVLNFLAVRLHVVESRFPHPFETGRGRKFVGIFVFVLLVKRRNFCLGGLLLNFGLEISHFYRQDLGLDASVQPLEVFPSLSRQLAT